MKKALPIVLAAGLAFGAMPYEPAAAASSGWTNNELKPGQIGRVTAIQDISVYEKSGTSFKAVSSLKKGQVSRVYTNRNGLFGIGGGKFVKADGSVAYETPSKSRYEAVNGIKSIKITAKDAPVEYPQMIGMNNKNAEQSINAVILRQANQHVENYKKAKLQEEKNKQQWEKDGKPYPWKPYEYKASYEIHFNKNHLLSVVVYEYQYMGGAHGMTVAKTLNFNSLNGSRFDLTTVIKNKTSVVKNYAAADLRNQSNRNQTAIFPDALKEIVIDSNREWTFHNKGLKLIFQEYEVGPYSSGMPEVIVPMSVYQ
ncbi:DUF3298 and DUF4163 domain-containing protein [Metabacillus sp. FJAT-52054]|uniref:DUF3298 and DUF4163 domain-containing protein n=1 Tax=Metabacillus sediminis TaxID=3117746 RepID=A0ABZ2NFT9_9BACI